jgi:hypothetical protein
MRWTMRPKIRQFERKKVSQPRYWEPITPTTLKMMARPASSQAIG